jgi:Ca2+-binding RTX toxin-like protein
VGSGRLVSLDALPSVRILAVVGAVLACLGLGVERADAAYTARVTGGVLVVTGNGAGDRLALRLQAGDPTRLQVDVGDNGSANFTFSRDLFAQIVVNAGAGNDIVRIDQANGGFTDAEITTIRGGDGRDTLVGGVGAETFVGGDANDFVDANNGSDTVLLGPGADMFVWDPGDDSDTVNGNLGTDTMRFNASNANEIMSLAANGTHLRLFRDVAAVTIDADDLENVDINALGGLDTVFVEDISATDTVSVDANLAATLGGTAGDGMADRVSVLGTAGSVPRVTGAGSVLTATGLPATVRVFNPEAANDLLSFGAGTNGLVNIDGSAAADVLNIEPSPVAGHVRVTTASLPAPVDVVSGQLVSVNGLGGNDSFSSLGNLAAVAQLRLMGGDGNDTILAGNGLDQVYGGPGNDFVDGQQGNDDAFLGLGNDTFQWDPGDGSDQVRGEPGTDRLLFNGSAGNENFSLSANGTNLRFVRDLGNITLDTVTLERVDLNALGGTDFVLVNNLTATDVTRLNVELAGTIGGTAGDGQVDTVQWNGAAGAETTTVARNGTFTDVGGVGIVMQLRRAEALNDRIAFVGTTGDVFHVNGTSAADTMNVAALGLGSVRATIAGMEAPIDIGAPATVWLNGLGGNDSLSASGNVAGTGVALRMSGGEGNDTVLGGNGAELLYGGPGNDFVDGNQANDSAFGGDGADIFAWDPGDGSDALRGHAGIDTLTFNGSAGAELFELSANGPRLRLFRNLGNITMDADDVERVAVEALGGADSLLVRNLAATDVTRVTADLEGVLGGGAGDGQVDVVTVNGTPARDQIRVAVVGGAVQTSGLPALVRILRSEVANDTLTVRGFGGVDTFSTGPGVTGLIGLTFVQN